MSVWLRDDAGVRVPLTHGSLLIGRSPSCHIVLANPRVSRQHALVTEVEGGAQVVPLGRAQLTLRGARVDEPTHAEDGDTLEVEGARFVLEVAREAGATLWLLESGSSSYPIRKPGFRVGSDLADDLRLPGWPPSAVALFPVLGAVIAEVNGAVELQGARFEGELAQLVCGSRLSAGGTTLTLARPADAPATVDLNPAPTVASLELMPNGALLKLTLDREHAVWLPHKRGDLLAALLSPPTGVKAGDWVPDELLLPRVWGTEPATRVQLNTLIHRARVTLSAAGLNGPSLIERAPGGGSTRVRLAKDAVTRVT